MRSLRFLVAPLLVACTFPAAHAGDRSIIGDPARDGVHTMQARKLLAADPDLASINIGVVVTDRVAVLWGPVPSADIAVAAEYCLRGMAELRGVRNELFVSEALEPIRVPMQIEVPPVVLPNPPPASGPRIPAQPLPAYGAPGVLTADVKVLRPEPTAQPDLATAIRTFLDGRSTFATVQFTIQDRQVFLSAAQDTDVMHEAARGISHLPGVVGVIIVDRRPTR